jgi:hypothetical protein
MTSIADQTVDELGGPGSVLVRQRDDHTELDALLERLQRTSGHEQDEVLTRTWRLVFRHAYAEETLLWPELRRVLPDGDEVTLRVEQEHQEINELAAALDRTPHGDPARAGLVTRLVDLLRQDARDEEDVLLPHLRDAVDAARLRSLGRSWQVVRRTAPTRPHAVVSRRPPGNVLAALPLALIDHSRDGLDTLARRTSGQVRTGAVAVSRALATLAGGVEKLPPLRRGERPSTARDAR